VKKMKTQHRSMLCHKYYILLSFFLFLLFLSCVA